MLSKTRTIMSRDPVRNDAAPTYWVQPDEGEQVRGHFLTLDHDVFVDMEGPEVITVTVEPGDKLNDEPDTHRTPTEADRVLAGYLSTVWPMNERHPEDCLHLAIAVNDLEGL